MPTPSPRAPVPLAAFLLAAALLSGCAGGPTGSGRDAQGEKIDRIILFKEAVSLRNFPKALRILSPEDSLLVVDADGRVPEGMQKRLRAVKLQLLVGQADVRVRNGRLTGVTAHLPVLIQGEPDEKTVFVLEPPLPPTWEEVQRDSVRRATRKLFASIAAERWQEALDALHPSTRDVFVTRNGRFKAGMRARLARADTASWDALSLRYGKLIGIVVLLPPPMPGLERATAAFFRAIRRGEWEVVEAMLVEPERERLSGTGGGITGGNRRRLAALDEADWDSLFLFRDKLSGVVELVEGEGPEPPT